jgi:CheY-like chemotaxis protein
MATDACKPAVRLTERRNDPAPDSFYDDQCCACPVAGHPVFIVCDMAEPMSQRTIPWRIGVVEDDDGLRAAILRMLGACRWEAIGFRSAENFLHAAALKELDCMVLDLYLPGISGFMLLEEARKRGVQAPAIMITAQDDAKVRERVLLADALYLPKPFTGDLLASTVRLRMQSQAE